MTKEDWAEAQAKTLCMFGRCELLVDGYHITLRMEPKTMYKNEIALYIDGKFEWKWCTEDCEIRRRFCRPVIGSAIRTQKQRDMLKKLTKKDQAAAKERMRFTYYLPYWNSFTALKRHFIANNHSLALVKDGESDAQL